MKQLSQHKTILSNFTYLSILNGLDILLPLLIIPYLTHTVGASNFGDYLFVLVLVQNINNLTAYGYGFSATKKISQYRDNIAKVNRIYNAVIGGRLLLGITIVGVILLFSPFIFKNEGQWFIFLTALGMVVGDIFIPSWLFQGMERMKFLTIVNATAKILFTLLVLVLITRQEDYLYILLINSTGFLLAAVVSQWLVRSQFHLQPAIPALSDVKCELRDGFTLFSTTIGMTLYRNLNILILNYFVSSASVAVYGIAEKIIKACQSLVNPIAQALFPNLSYRFSHNSMQQNIVTLRKLSGYIGVLLLAATTIISLCVPLFPLIFGEEFKEAIPLTYVMLPVFFFGCMNFVLGFSGLVNLNKQKYFLFAVIASGTLSIIILLTGSPFFGIKAAAWAMNISEISLFMLCLYKLIKLYYEK